MYPSSVAQKSPASARRRYSKQRSYDIAPIPLTDAFYRISQNGIRRTPPQKRDRTYDFRFAPIRGIIAWWYEIFASQRNMFGFAAWTLR